MDVAGLGVGDAKVMVRAMAVGFVLQLAVKGEDVPHQVALKLLHILLAPLAFQKLLPRQKQILNGDDILKAMSENFPMMNPPPQDFARFGASQTGLPVVA